MKNAWIPILVIGITFSCISDPGSSDTNDLTTSDVFIQLLSERKIFERTYGDCESDTTNTCTSVSIAYPFFSGTLNPEAENRINERVTSMLVDNMLYDSMEYDGYEEFTQAFIEEYIEIRNEFGETFGWQYDGDVTILRNDSALLSLKVATYIYTGGAHGMYTVRYINLDPDTGEAFEMNDIFVPPYADSLSSRIKKALIRQKGLKSEADLSDAGYQFMEEEYYTENFALLTDSVLFYFNQYEIAPYSAGPTRISLPVKDIQDLLKKEFK